MAYDSLTIFLCVSVFAITCGMTITIGKKKLRFEPKGKHCYIGGGSQGLGLALAELLLEKGAHVTIVSRSQKKLDQAVKQLESSRVSKEQKINAVSADLTTSDGAGKALDEAAVPFDGRAPDYVFACAGGAGSILGYFVELNEDQLKHGFEVNYLAGMWTAHAAARRMVKQGITGGAIVLTSSVLGFFALPGYAAYTPAKHALRGLAETLRVEMLMYDIGVHCYFPATIHSPGFEEEQKCKPELTKNIEGPDEGLSPEEAARRLIKGLEKRQFLITTDGIGHVFRNSMRGISPLSTLGDVFLGAIAPLVLPIWRRHMDREVLEFGDEHRKQVVDKL